VGLKTKLCRELAPFILDIFNEALTAQKAKIAERKEKNGSKIDSLGDDTLFNEKTPMFPYIKFYAAMASLC